MATETTNKYTMNTFKNIFSHFQVTYHKNMMFINITISISENGISYKVFQVKTRYKILTFSPRRRNSLNGVVDETNSCKGEFTSGSRPGSSRPAILRSLMLHRLRPTVQRIFKTLPGKYKYTGHFYTLFPKDAALWPKEMRLHR